MRLRLVACTLLCAAGCGPQRPAEFTVSGQPLEHWLTALGSEQGAVRERAVTVLSNVGPADPRVVPALTSALRDKNPGIRGRAALALLKIGGGAREAVETLTNTAENDPDPAVRGYASKAVARIKGTD